MARLVGGEERSASEYMGRPDYLFFAYTGFGSPFLIHSARTLYLHSAGSATGGFISSTEQGANLMSEKIVCIYIPSRVCVMSQSPSLCHDTTDNNFRSQIFKCANDGA